MKQQIKFVVRHVGIHVIVVNMFQVGTNLFEQDQQIRIIAYQMFRYHRIYLTKKHSTFAWQPFEKYSPTASCLSDVTSSKIKIEFGRASLGGTSLLLENVK